MDGMDGMALWDGLDGCMVTIGHWSSKRNFGVNKRKFALTILPIPFD